MKLDSQLLKVVYKELNGCSNRLIKKLLLDRVFIEHPIDGATFFHRCAYGNFLHQAKNKLEARNYCGFLESLFERFDYLGKPFFDHVLSHLMTKWGIFFVRPVKSENMLKKDNRLKKQRKATFYNRNGILKKGVFINNLSPTKMAEAGLQYIQSSDNPSDLVYCESGRHYLSHFNSGELPIGRHLREEMDCPWVDQYFSSTRFVGSHQEHYQVYLVLLTSSTVSEISLDKHHLKELDQTEMLAIAYLVLFRLYYSCSEKIKNQFASLPNSHVNRVLTTTLEGVDTNSKLLIGFFSNYLEHRAMSNLKEYVKAENEIVIGAADKLKLERYAETILESIRDMFFVCAMCFSIFSSLYYLAVIINAFDSR